MGDWARTEPSDKEGMVELIVGDVMVGYIFTDAAETLTGFLNQSAACAEMMKQSGLISLLQKIKE